MILEIALSVIVIVLIYIVIETKRKKSKEENFKRQVQQPTLLVWDVENYSIRYFDTLFEKIKKTPLVVFASTNRDLLYFEKFIIEKFGFIYMRAKRTEIADDVLMEYALHNKEKYESFIFLTSDSDFVPCIQELLNLKKKVTLFTTGFKNQRMLKMLDQTDQNLKISPLNISKPLWKKKKVTSDIKPPKKKPKVKPICPQCSICNKMTRKMATTKLEEAPVCIACINLFSKRFPKKQRTSSRAVLYTQFKNEYHEDMKTFGFYDIEKYVTKNTSPNQNNDEQLKVEEIL